MLRAGPEGVYAEAVPEGGEGPWSLELHAGRLELRAGGHNLPFVRPAVTPP